MILVGLMSVGKGACHGEVWRGKWTHMMEAKFYRI
jgi:hypothetical protein